MFNKIQPLQGCDVILFPFRRLHRSTKLAPKPTVIQIKPILGFQKAQVRRTWIWITSGETGGKGNNKFENPEVGSI